MQRQEITFTICLSLTIVAVGAGLSVFFSQFVDLGGAMVTAPPASALVSDVAPVASRQVSGLYHPPRLEDAPSDIRDSVHFGYNIMVDTPRYADKYVGDQLKCVNCHFQAGITDGGRNGGLSLVGVAAKYPIYRARAHSTVDLFARTNSCFERSMNGRPLPVDSPEMTALITFYQWISKGLPVYEEVPWLGLKKLESDHVPDATAGKAIYADNCASCHGSDGAGTRIGPPMWGDHAFNDGAGMSKLPTIAAFVHLNMPKGNPYLTIDEALDVAAFVAEQPRPHFVEEN